MGRLVGGTFSDSHLRPRQHTKQLLSKTTVKVFRIGTVRYNWPMSAHASQAFSIAHCTDSEDLPTTELNNRDSIVRMLYEDAY